MQGPGRAQRCPCPEAPRPARLWRQRPARSGVARLTHACAPRPDPHWTKQATHRDKWSRPSLDACESNHRSACWAWEARQPAHLSGASPSSSPPWWPQLLCHAWQQLACRSPPWSQLCEQARRERASERGTPWHHPRAALRWAGARCQSQSALALERLPTPSCRVRERLALTGGGGQLGAAARDAHWRSGVSHRACSVWRACALADTRASSQHSSCSSRFICSRGASPRVGFQASSAARRSQTRAEGVPASGERHNVYPAAGGVRQCRPARCPGCCRGRAGARPRFPRPMNSHTTTAVVPCATAAGCLAAVFNDKTTIVATNSEVAVLLQRYYQVRGQGSTHPNIKKTKARAQG